MKSAPIIGPIDHYIYILLSSTIFDASVNDDTQVCRHFLGRKIKVTFELNVRELKTLFFSIIATNKIILNQFCLSYQSLIMYYLGGNLVNGS